MTCLAFQRIATFIFCTLTTIIFTFPFCFLLCIRYLLAGNVDKSGPPAVHIFQTEAQTKGVSVQVTGARVMPADTADNQPKVGSIDASKARKPDIPVIEVLWHYGEQGKLSPDDLRAMDAVMFTSAKKGMYNIPALAR
jgi:hypothetical protein